MPLGGRKSPGQPHETEPIVALQQVAYLTTARFDELGQDFRVFNETDGALSHEIVLNNVSCAHVNQIGME